MEKMQAAIAENKNGIILNMILYNLTVIAKLLKGSQKKLISQLFVALQKEKRATYQNSQNPLYILNDSFNKQTLFL